MYPDDQNMDLNSDAYKDIGIYLTLDALAQSVDDSYPPPTKYLWQHEISDFLPSLSKLYTGLQKVICLADQKVKSGGNSFLRPKFIRKADWLDDLLAEAIEAVNRIRFFPDVDIPVNAISVDAYASQFQWIDWSRKVVNGPPSNIHREVY